MQRLHDLYLYSENAMLERDFILRKTEIGNRMKEINARLGMITQNTETVLSDEEFIKQASHLLIQKELQNKTYIYFKDFVTYVDPDILKTYMSTILDVVYIADGQITSIVFKNGLCHKFIYKDI